MSIRDLLPWRRSEASSLRREPQSLSALQREINRVFDDVLSDVGLSGGFGVDDIRGFGEFVPRIDLKESDKAIDVSIEVPGMTGQDVKVELTDDAHTLVLSGEKRSEKSTKEHNFHRTERSYGQFRRVIALPCRIDAQQVDATCKNGVLDVHLPKLPDAQQRIRKIPVRT